jgi:predicted nucleic acid-binding protein
VTQVSHYLVDTGVFILYLCRNRSAIDFFRSTAAVIYHSRMTRKKLLRPPISTSERVEVLAVLQQYCIVSPDPQIAQGFAALLEKYAYLRDQQADALIAATAWKKNLEVVTTNPRHFTPIAEIQVRRFPEG